MKHRSRSLPVLVVVAVVALVLGSFGTAVAGSALTKGQVKRIAAKVVKKQAPSLSVAHATSATDATNATNLAGLPSSSFLDNAVVFTVPVTAPAGGHTVTIPLAPGTYQISYSAFLVGGTGASFCQLRKPSTGLLVFATADDTANATPPSMSGTGVVSVGAGDTVGLLCLSPSDWVTAPTEPIQIVVTPLDSVTNSTLTATRTTPSGTRP
jgi:hypothetical protein